MLTGDHLAISREVAQQLEIGMNIYDPKKLGLGRNTTAIMEGSEVFDFVEGADG